MTAPATAPRWEGYCQGCSRHRPVETRYSHAARVLCDDCAAKPHRLPSGSGLDAPPRAAAPPAEAAPPAGPLTVRASDVRSVPIRWLWGGRLALGKLAVLVGIEGIGKSALTAWLAARITRGELHGELEGKPSAVLIIAGEDAYEDTWKPRLAVAGADLDLVRFLNLDALPKDWNVRDGAAQLRQALAETDAVLVVFDALLDHLPAARAGENVNQPTYVRGALGPLRTIVRERGIAGVFGLHPPKGPRLDFRDLVQASQAFTAIVRTGLLIAWHPEDDALPEHDRRRVLLRGKGNIGRNPGALAFRIGEVPYVYDDGTDGAREAVLNVEPSPVTLRDLAPGRMLGDVEREPTKIEQAAAMMRAELEDGDRHPSAPIIARIRDALGGASNGTLTDARRLAGVTSERDPLPRSPTFWRLSVTGDRRTDGLPLARDYRNGTDGLTENPPESLLGTQSVSESVVCDGSAVSDPVSQSVGDPVGHRARNGSDPSPAARSAIHGPDDDDGHGDGDAR